MTDSEQPEIDAAVNLFIHGAKTLSVGHYLNENRISLKGLAILKTAARTLDELSGRDPLLRLLDDPNDFVPTVAAAGVWQSHTQRARKIMEEVQRLSITEAGMLACTILLFHGRHNPVSSDPRYMGLHEDENGVDQWHDPAFRGRALSGELPSTFARRPVTRPMQQGGESS